MQEGRSRYPESRKQFNYYELKMNDSLPVLTQYIDKGTYPLPNYIIMSGNKHFEERLSRLKTMYPELQYETDIKPGLIDKIAYQLNPKHNVNETWHIYKIKK